MLRIISIMGVYAVFQSLGYFDYRLFCAVSTYLSWQVMRLFYPILIARCEFQMAWYAIKGVIITKRICGPVYHWSCVYIFSPLYRGIIGIPDHHCVFLIGAEGETVEELGLDVLRPGGLKDVQSLPDYRFIIYEWLAPADPLYSSYILRFDSLDAVTDRFEFSEMKFLAPRITVGDDDDAATQKVFELADEFANKNYYMAGNRLFDRDFVTWYLRKHHEFNLKTNIYYRVDFIDNKMSMQRVTPDKALVIHRLTYNIIKTDSSTPKEEDVVLRQRLPRPASAITEGNPYAAENISIKAGFESRKDIKVDSNAAPSHIKWWWGQFY